MVLHPGPDHYWLSTLLGNTCYDANLKKIMVKVRVNSFTNRTLIFTGILLHTNSKEKRIPQNLEKAGFH